MDRLKTTLSAAFVIAILFAPTASAQPAAARVQVVSGNGQLICITCPSTHVPSFRPMVVKVTDANGNPIGGKTVNWQLVSSNGVQPFFNFTTITDGNGISVNSLSGGFQLGIPGFYFLQSTISATVDSVSASFIETQALTDANTNQQVVFSRLDAPNFGTPLTGPAGSTGTSPIQVHVDARGTPVPYVSLRILSPEVTTASGQVILDPAAPSASCLTAPGADPGSVLTDANGNATCYPVFGPVAGTGSVDALLGGLDPIQFDQTISPLSLTEAVAFHDFPGIQIVVSPVTPGRIAIVSGNNQSVNPGQASSPLVVQVTDGTGAVTIANTSVAWTVTGGAATVSPTVSSTNEKGQAQTTVTLSPSAGGQITVRAALQSSSNISTSFNLSTNILVASLAKVSGDGQTTQTGKNFGAPLVVQVNGTNGQPVSNQAVSFLVNGNATLSATSVLTDGNGQARITVAAGPTPGTVSVNAFVGNISQTFTLTVIPPGPALSSNSFFNAGGTNRIGALSPCSLVTVLTSGLAPNVQGMVFNSSAFGPWGTILASDAVTVNNVAAPVFSVGNLATGEQLTFQVPCETVPGNSVPITINVGGGSATITFPVVAASPGIFETVMSDSVRRAVVIRPDGTFASLQNPARRGEIVRVLVTGMGPAVPAVVTGALPIPGADSLVLGQVIVGVNNSGARVVTSRVAPNLIGVYELAFEIPSDAPTGNDIVLSVDVLFADGVDHYSNGSKLPIQ